MNKLREEVPAQSRAHRTHIIRILCAQRFDVANGENMFCIGCGFFLCSLFSPAFAIWAIPGHGLEAAIRIDWLN